MRINKYIAQAGIASRRKADELIRNGNVKVNGAVLKEPGYDVEETDKVQVNGRLVGAPQKFVYFLVNKPTGMVTTVDDDRDRPTVMDIITDTDARLFPVGRLDYNTSGALIMTNDGDLAYRVSHPRHEQNIQSSGQRRYFRGKACKTAQGSGHRGICHISCKSEHSEGERRVYACGDNHTRGEKPPGAQNVCGCRQSGADP